MTTEERIDNLAHIPNGAYGLPVELQKTSRYFNPARMARA